ncbi:MAG TPA: hypothetical protein PKH65_05055 [Bacteroidia bacterium]|nr:hypothetical protein [Bacteroidia bacterium]HNT80029.1 hypothetical protein [Bacteroidia bacterium]
MKTSRLYLFTILTVTLALSISSCKKNNEDDEHSHTTSNGSLKLKFDHSVNGTALVLNSSNYINQNNDTFNVSLIKYYISNILLTKTDNSVVTLPASYHLISSESGISSDFTLSSVPSGNYKKISFLLGVDSTRNVSGAQSGALDPANGMFWSWSSGYIFYKLEGKSPQSMEANNAITYHIGGFAGANSALRTIEVDFGAQTLTVPAHRHTPLVQFNVHVEEIFKTPTQISISTLPKVVMPGANAFTLSTNFSDMFTIGTIIN